MALSSTDLATLRIKDYKIYVINAINLVVQDVSGFVTNITWSYDLDQAVEQWVIELVHTQSLQLIVQEGDRVQIHATRANADGLDYGELRELFVLETDLDSDQMGNMRVTCVDNGQRLVGNTHSCVLDEGETADQFIKRICEQFAIPVGDLVETNIPLARQIFMNKSLWDMFVTALSLTRNRDSEARFLLRIEMGKVTLIEKKDPATVWVFEEGRIATDGSMRGNLMKVTHKRSLQNYKNIVRVYRGMDPTVAEASPDGGPEGEYPPGDEDPGGDIARYGMWVESVSFEDFDAPMDPQTQAEILYRRLHRVEDSGHIESFNINTLRAGDPVYIYAPVVGLVGKYYIKSGSHTVTDNQSIMALTVNFWDDLPESYKSQIEKGSLFLSEAVAGG